MSADRLEQMRKDIEEVCAELEWSIPKLRAIHRRLVALETAPPIVVAGPLSFLETRLQRHAVEAESRVLTHNTCAAPCGSCFDEPPGEAA